MAGIKPLRKIQIGAESTAGTAVAATTYWRGNGVLADSREITVVEEDTGFISGIDRMYTPKYEGAMSFDEIEATFEQLPYILNAGVMAATGVKDGSGSGYIYTYNFPTTSKPTIKTYTIEMGDDQQAEEMEYCFVDEFTISGKAGEPVTMSANWIGRQVANTTFTGSLSMPTVEEMLFGKAKLYINATSTYPASTQITQSFLSFDLKVKTGWQPVYTGDGNLYFTFAKITRPEITLTLRLEHDSQSVAEKAAWKAGTARAVRILVEGGALTTAGTTYTNKTLAIDLVGKYTEVGGLDDEDDNDVIELTLTSRYNSTAAAAGRIIVVNSLTSLP